MSNFFFINRKNIQKNNFQFDSDESHHLINVMRLKIGSEIHFTDGEGGAYIGLVSSFDNDIVSGNILNVYNNIFYGNKMGTKLKSTYLILLRQFTSSCLHTYASAIIGEGVSLYRLNRCCIIDSF